LVAKSGGDAPNGSRGAPAGRGAGPARGARPSPARAGARPGAHAL